MHIGPVQAPTEIDEVYKNYLAWVKTIDPSVLPDDLTDDLTYNNEIAATPTTIQEMEFDDDTEPNIKN